MENGENELRLMSRNVWIALILVFSGLGLWEWQDHVGYAPFDNLRQQQHGQ